MMKKLTLLFALLLCSTLTVVAQGYQSYFGNSSTTYHIFRWVTTYDPDPHILAVPGWTFVFKVTQNDTVHINDTVYLRPDWMDMVLREDTLTGRIYCRYPNRPEQLVCDMSLMVGDTFVFPSEEYGPWYMEAGGKMTVDSISYLNGKKIIHFSPLFDAESAFYPYITAPGIIRNPTFFNFNITFVEGVGPTYGVFGYIEGCERFLGLMLCVEKDDTLTYMTDPKLGCTQFGDFGSGGPYINIKELETDQLKLFPNPATSSLHVELGSEVDAYGTLYIIDVVGQVVYSKKKWSNQEDIPITHLSRGIYVVLYQTKNRKYQNKFIKK